MISRILLCAVWLGGQWKVGGVNEGGPISVTLLQCLMYIILYLAYKCNTKSLHISSTIKIVCLFFGLFAFVSISRLIIIVSDQTVSSHMIVSQDH